jgi:hypothetical protein
MSGVVASGSTAAWSRRRTAGLDLPDARRALQLWLAGLWLLDAALQFQSFMFTKGFAHQILASSADGNPAFVAGPINSAAHLVAHHPAGANAAFATTQLLLGLGIAWRPTVKIALAASMMWALSVWWLGEGLGGVLIGQAGPISGGPGAALLYVLLAMLLWPPSASASGRVTFVGAGALGATRARLLWLVLWAALAGFAGQGANRSANGLHDVIADSTGGQPAWVMAIGNHAATLVAHRGLAISIVLAVMCAVIAIGVFGTTTALRATVVLAAVLAAVIWVAGQALGAMFGGQGTDPNTGPLLILMALAYWPYARPARPSDGVSW